MKQLLISIALTASALLAGGQALAADCGKVVIGEMNWASGEFLARLDGFILKEGYGCEVEYLTAGTMPQITSMNEKGSPDFASELWANAAAVAIDAAVGEGRLVKLNPAPISGAGEGWFVSAAAAAAYPELKTIDDIIKRPDLFPHPEDPGKGGLHTCPPGWGCQLATANLFRALDMEAKGWKIIETGSGAGLNGSISKAGERNENWIGYHWAPTLLVGKYNLKQVDLNSGFDQAHWDNCISKAVEECANPKRSNWTVSEVVSLAQTDFAKREPAAADYIKARTFGLELLGKYLTYMGDNQASGEDTAIEFLLKEESAWNGWVSASALTRIKAAL
ncbi:ABC transporter substrate-binding protein [Litorivicinus sp.]|nr:ABC transporter substrate-binding protein [Litorivicinus sp.]MDC1240487.1 ABC transporter substrate-binding protein [Litorivicinus sp.]